MRRAAPVIAAAALTLGAAAGAGGAPGAKLPRGGETVHLDPADFTTKIDNPWWPMRPGTRWVYRETDSQGARQRWSSPSRAARGGSPTA
jgi:hypothetical protein